MPIDGLTTQTRLDRALPKIGKLYKGAEKRERQKDGRTYEITGLDLDHFRMEFEPEFEYLRPVWENLYGKKPAEFRNVYILGQTANEAFQNWKEQWNTSETLIHRCDGVTQVSWWDERRMANNISRIACASVQGQPRRCECEPVGRLGIRLLDFTAETGVVGYISLATHSINDIMNLFNRITHIEHVYGKGMDRVPFVLGRSEQIITTTIEDKQGHKKRGKVKKSLLYLHVEPWFVKDNMLEALKAPPTAIAMLPEGYVGDVIEAEIVDEETRAEQTERARKALGTGDKPRRIGATQQQEPPAPPLPDDIPDADYDDGLDPIIIPPPPPEAQALLMTKAVFITMAKRLLNCKDGELRANLAKYFNRSQLAEIFEGVDTNYDAAYRELEANFSTL